MKTAGNIPNANEARELVVATIRHGVDQMMGRLTANAEKPLAIRIFLVPLVSRDPS